MPKISNKGQLMPESPIRKLVPFSEEAIKKGKKVYHLNIGQPDIKTPEIALKAIKNANISTLAYSRSEGSESYRHKISNYYKTHNIDINQDDIIVTTGGSEALLFAFGSIMDHDDEIIIPEPFYANYNGFSTASNVNVVPVISKIDDNFALPPVESFEALISEKTKAILICNPGNPTGYLYSKEEIQKLAALVKKHDLFLIADEVYREFVYDDNTFNSILSETNISDNAIVIDSVSKRYSMCGARIGYLVSRNKNFIQTALKFAQARLSPPTLAQIAGEAALETPDSYFEEVITAYNERRNLLIKELSTIKDVKIGIPQGAFYCIVELPIKNADHFAQWLLQNYDYENETVMIAPAAGFYSTKGMGNNQVRIAYVLEKNSLIKAVNILKLGLEKYLLECN